MGADSTTQASWLDEGPPPRPRPEPRTCLARALGPGSERQVHGRNAEAGEPSSGSWRRRASGPATRWWRPPRRPCGATLPAALPVPASGHSEPSSTFAVARGSLSRMLPRHRRRQKSEAMVLTETLSNVRAGGPFCARDGGVREARSCPGETPPGPDAAQVRRRPGRAAPAPLPPGRQAGSARSHSSRTCSCRNPSGKKPSGYLRSLTGKET